MNIDDNTVGSKIDQHQSTLLIALQTLWPSWRPVFTASRSKSSETHVSGHSYNIFDVGCAVCAP